MIKAEPMRLDTSDGIKILLTFLDNLKEIKDFHII